MSDSGKKAAKAKAGDEGEAPAVTDPRPPSQIEAEEGARDGTGPYDPAPRAAEAASAKAYAKDGIWGAPGSEVPESAARDDDDEDGDEDGEDDGGQEGSS